MKYFSSIILLLFFFNIKAQLADCSYCHTINYTTEDIEGNSLFELQLLRNEIFARHQYIFKDDRLGEYFQGKQWYQPDFKNPAKVELNDIEKANIAVFRAKETLIKERRKSLFAQLKELKKALNKNDSEKILSFLNDEFGPGKETPQLSLTDLKSSFNKIDLNNVNWYKGKAFYQTSIDNGFKVTTTYLGITDFKITLSSADAEHSKIIEEPFKYGSKYYSEDEFKIWYHFSFEKDRLKLIKVEVAG